ncbi:RNA polymerase subunit sigma [Streptomyces sp. NPDC088732]|uniref:RNA polymerase subunit sigma n=1 Tax=Streptomyces sp. NPDC088732 TaxID=3365879 RepID=UPI0038179E72
MDFAGEAVSLAELLDERRHLLDVAYRMVGSDGEAEGVVVETYRRWYALSDTARAQIATPRSWLAATAGGICRARQDLPGRSGNPAQDTERADFAGGNAFGTAPAAVADAVGKGRPGSLAPAARACRWLRSWRARTASPVRHDALVTAVREACAAEDAGLLASLLAADATAVFDGGGKVRALVRPVHGSEQVARSLLVLLARRPRTTLRAQPVSGRTGLVVRCDHQVAAVISLGLTGDRVGRVGQVWVVLNPDKLRPWNESPAS